MLTGRLNELAQHWHFEPDFELPRGYCCRAWASEDRILRVPFQGEELTSGFHAALLLSGWGPTIFEHDQETGALFMERLVPGEKLMFSAVPDEQRVEIVAEMIRYCRSVSPPPAPSLPSGEGGLMPLSQYYSQPIPGLEELLATSPPPVFLHGDLHPENVLSGRGGWVCIDPKGLVGDPHFEPVAFLRNVMDHDNPVGEAKGRVEQFADLLDLESARVLRWLQVDLRSSEEELSAAQRKLLEWLSSP